MDLLGRPLHRRRPGSRLPPGGHQSNPVQDQVLSLLLSDDGAAVSRAYYVVTLGLPISIPIPKFDDVLCSCLSPENPDL